MATFLPGSVPSCQSLLFQLVASRAQAPQPGEPAEDSCKPKRSLRYKRPAQETPSPRPESGIAANSGSKEECRSLPERRSLQAGSTTPPHAPPETGESGKPVIRRPSAHARYLSSCGRRPSCQAPEKTAAAASETKTREIPPRYLAERSSRVQSARLPLQESGSAVSDVHRSPPATDRKAQTPAHQRPVACGGTNGGGP